MFLRVTSVIVFLLLGNSVSASYSDQSIEWNLANYPQDITRVQIDGSPKIAILILGENTSFKTVDIETLLENLEAPVPKTVKLGDGEGQPMMINQLFPQCLISSKKQDNGWVTYQEDGMEDSSYFKDANLFSNAKISDVYVDDQNKMMCMSDYGFQIVKIIENNCSDYQLVIERL